MKAKTLLATTAFLCSFSVLADANEASFNALCTSCHSTQGSSGIAPPAFGVVSHTKEVYPSREAFVQRVVDWVTNPNADEALMPGAVNKFGVMPKLGYPEDQVRAAANYLFDADLTRPQGHGQGHGKGQGH